MIFFTFWGWLIVYIYVVSVVPIFAPSISEIPWDKVIELLLYNIPAERIVVEEELIIAVINVPSSKVIKQESEKRTLMLFWK